MLSEFLSYIIYENIISDDDGKILLAVSGGVDSMVMADLFLKAGLKFGIAHVNHNTRGLESDLDHELVKSWCTENMIPFFEHYIDKSVSENGNFQAEARKIRRQWMEKTAQEEKYDLIATAHHRNDEAETFFINLQRSSGLKGLSGYQAVNGQWAKPLLFAFRSDIEKYAKENEILFRHDKSNDSDKYLRNLIRHHVIPNLFPNENFDALENSQYNIRKSNQLLSHLIYASPHVYRDGQNMIIEKDYLKSLPHPDVFLHYLLEEKGFNKSQMEDILLSDTNGAKIISESHTVVNSRGHLYVMENRSEMEDLEVMSNGQYALKDGRSIIIKEVCDRSTINYSDGSQYLGFDVSPFPLTVRSKRSGDHYTPLGMRGSQSVKNFIVDNKLNPIQKNELLIVEIKEEIACILPYRISEAFKVQQDSAIVLQFTLI